jgi:hypothetical protein
MAQAQTDELNAPFNCPNEEMTRVSFQIFRTLIFTRANKSLFFGAPCGTNSVLK